MFINYLDKELNVMQNPKDIKHPPTNYYQQFRGFIQLSNSFIPHIYDKNVQQP